MLRIAPYRRPLLNEAEGVCPGLSLARGVTLTLACHGPSSSSSSKTANQQTTQSTDGDYSPTVSAGGKVAVAAPVITAEAGSKGNISYTLTDGGAIAAISDVVKAVLANQSESDAQILDALQQSNSASTAAITSLATTSATGGESQSNSTVVKVALIAGAVIVGGLLAVFGLPAFFTRKKS